MTGNKMTLDSAKSWIVLVAAFMSLFLNGGLSYTVGVYMVEWQDAFDSDAASMGMLASQIGFASHIAAVFAGALCKRYGCRLVLLTGGGVATVTVFLATFASQLWHLHILMVIASCAYGVAYIPNVVVIAYHFEKYLRIANGIVYSGVGIGALCMAPVIQELCDIFGWEGAMLIHSGLIANMLVCAMVYIPTEREKESIASAKEATPLKQSASEDDVGQTMGNCTENCLEGRKYETKNESPTCFTRLKGHLLVVANAFDIPTLFRNNIFILFLSSCTITSLCLTSYRYFMTSKLVLDLSVNKTLASFSLTVHGACSAISRFLNGIVLDLGIISSTNLCLLAFVIIGTSAILNPISETYWAQMVLAGLLGFGAGTLYPSMSIFSREQVGVDKLANAVGFLFGICGIGSLIGNQMMGALYDATGSYDVPFYVAGGVQCLAVVAMIFLSFYQRWQQTNHLKELAMARSVSASPGQCMAVISDVKEYVLISTNKMRDTKVTSVM